MDVCDCSQPDQAPRCLRRKPSARILVLCSVYGRRGRLSPYVQLCRGIHVFIQCIRMRLYRVNTQYAHTLYDTHERPSTTELASVRAMTSTARLCVREIYTCLPALQHVSVVIQICCHPQYVSVASLDKIRQLRKLNYFSVSFLQFPFKWTKQMLPKRHADYVAGRNWVKNSDCARHPKTNHTQTQCTINILH